MSYSVKLQDYQPFCCCTLIANLGRYWFQTAILPTTDTANNEEMSRFPNLTFSSYRNADTDSEVKK